MQLYSSEAFRPGQRVQLSPGTDLWARSDKFGTVLRVYRKFIVVEMDRSGRTFHVDPAHIAEIL